MTAAAVRSIDLGRVLPDVATAMAVMVGDLRLDSRDISPGDAFVAVSGRSTHGLKHVESAIARGAIAILHDPADRFEINLPESVCIIPVPNLAARLGPIADSAYGEPSAAIEVVGITGTNGKTTCAWLYAMCRDSNAAYLGTLGAGRPPHLTATTHTTADVASIHRMLARFRDQGAVHAALEVSSHALDQGRVCGVRLPIVAFTNLTRDHLDYHGSMAAYGAAKESLFAHPGVRQAVINIDDAFGLEILGRLPAGVESLCVSLRTDAPKRGQYLVASRIECRDKGLRVVGDSHLGAFSVDTQLVGRFNAENLLVVLGLLLASGLPLREATGRLAGVTAPPGRMEAFSALGGPLVVVDYAHTPDALDKALTALRSHVSGHLYCVFGCGGDRDTGKRPLMAKVAEALADHVIVTDDNPRTEDPDQIIAMIVAAFSEGVSVRIERDRELAIRSAVAQANPGDIVLIAGKGHEDYQIYGAESRHFSDREIAMELTRRAA